MFQNWCFLLLAINTVLCYPSLFETKSFKVGIEYDNSLPMSGGSDRYRHRNNYDPFFVTITAKAKSGYVITYLEVTATVDAGAKLDFTLIRGATGSMTMSFQLVSNNSDFLSYSYLTYGITEEKYKKFTNIISMPMTNDGPTLRNNGFTIFATVLIISALNVRIY